MQIKNFLELRDYLNIIPEEDLTKSELLVCEDEETGFRIKSISRLEEDYYVDDDGNYPVSTFDESDYDEPLSNFDIIPKGTLYFYTE